MNLITYPNTPWIKLYRPNSQRCLRLFCFNYAGAGASIFHAWAEKLPVEIEVCSIQLPGREDRFKESLFTDISLLSQTLSPILLPYTGLPFAFFGHSLGALLCYEVARQLRQQHSLSPIRLFVSSRSAPQLSASSPPLHQMPESVLVEQLRSINGTPEILLQDQRWRKVFLPILRADLSLSETYTYTPDEPLDCPISAFGGLQDSSVSVAQLEAWRYQTHNSFTLKMFEGNHFFLNKVQPLLLQAISQLLLS